MSSKVLFVKYVPHLLSGDEHSLQKSLCAAANSTNSFSTVVVLKSKGNSFSIQGFPDIPCKEKDKTWSLFQKAVKQLLGVSADQAICIRFSDPPCTALTSLSKIFREPSHIINLIASPIPHTDPLSFELVPPPTQPHPTKTRRDPYCQYRDLFHHEGHMNTGQPSALVKRKCDFADMAKLLSQLEEVSLSLQRTQQACDMIAERCGPTKPSTLCAKAPLSAIDSGKGSSSSEEEHLIDGIESEDRRVEDLLQVAESIAQHPPLPPTSRDSTDSPLVDEDSVSLPDPPSGVTVQPSLTEGGIYVMWDPVRLDASDLNHSHTVLGYMVYLDKRLRAKVEGSLSSQAELVKDLEDGREYTVQVCTHTNHCNSLLSSAVKYRHTTKRSKPQSQARKTRVTHKQESKSKAARIESWLLNGHISDTSIHTLANGVHGSVTEQTPSPSHHVHFASGGSYSKWAEQVDGHLVDSGCEDTRSTASSHTSGIVTDFPMSPHVKQTPYFPCLDCSSTVPDSHSISTHISNLHSDDGFHTLTRCTCLEEISSTIATKSSLSSTLCPTCRESRAESEACSIDTIIDEPLKLSPQSTPQRRHTEGTENVRSKPEKRLLRMKQKRPEAPENLSVYQTPGDLNWLILEWTPVSCDSKGCNKGFFILGYRIYVDNKAQQSVNGSMTCQARIKCVRNGSSQCIKLDVRSRAMAGESDSSSPVYFNLNTHHQQTVSHDAMSNLRCPSVGSLVISKSEASSRHTIQPRSQRVETYV